jgi:hypothetical protein
MATQRKKAKANSTVKFKDLKSSENPQGGAVNWGWKNQKVN